MTAAAAHLPRTERPGSLAEPFARHGLIFVGGAVAAYVVAAQLPVGGQPLVWLAGAVVLGLASALIGRGWLGLLFVLVGLGIGLALELHLRVGPGSEAVHELGRHGPIYLAAAAVLVVTYAATLIAIGLLRR